MKIGVIIPARNEGAKIYQVVRSVLSYGYDAIVIDDCSCDNTGKEAKRAGAYVLSHFINRGYGAALETGNKYALKEGYDIVVHFDADGQHRSDEIKNMVSPIIRNEAEVVIGSRFIKKSKSMPFARRALIKLAIVFTWIFSGIKLTDAHNGFRAFKLDVLERVDCRQDGMSYASEIIDQIAENKLCYKEVPVTIEYSDYSKSKGESNIKKVFTGVKFLWGKVIK